MHSTPVEPRYSLRQRYVENPYLIRAETVRDGPTIDVEGLLFRRVIGKIQCDDAELIPADAPTDLDWRHTADRVTSRAPGRRQHPFQFAQPLILQRHFQRHFGRRRIVVKSFADLLREI